MHARVDDDLLRPMGEVLGPDVLYRTLVDHALDLQVTLDGIGTITFANGAAQAGLGYGPGLVGRNALDLLHPEDVERAAEDLASLDEFGAPRGTSSFRLRHADGHYVMLDVTSHAVSDGTQELLAVTGRPAEDRRATDEIVLRLLRGGSRHEVLGPVCDLFAWQANGTQIGISWLDPAEGWTYVSTGLPPHLAGADGEAADPWNTARLRHQELVGSIGPSDRLDLDHRALAQERGFSDYWIVPVPDVGGRPPALITVWGSAGRRPAQVHAYGMSVARTFVELILRWTHQAQRLDDAAHTDTLTGLANRKAFFDRLDEVIGSGALLYCDLDRFKPVNDALGHTAGDAVLRQAADRLRATVRVGDLVARIGGDEFVVLCDGATAEQAVDLAARIRAAFAPPFNIGVRSIEVGISVGIGLAAHRLSVDTLEAADQELYRAKGAHRPPA